MIYIFLFIIFLNVYHNIICQFCFLKKRKSVKNLLFSVCPNGNNYKRFNIYKRSTIKYDKKRKNIYLLLPNNNTKFPIIKNGNYCILNKCTYSRRWNLNDFLYNYINILKYKKNIKIGRLLKCIGYQNEYVYRKKKKKEKIRLFYILNKISLINLKKSIRYKNNYKYNNINIYNSNNKLCYIPINHFNIWNKETFLYNNIGENMCNRSKKLFKNVLYYFHTLDDIKNAHQKNRNLFCLFNNYIKEEENLCNNSVLIYNIFKASQIYNYAYNESIKKILKEIIFLFHKIKKNNFIKTNHNKNIYEHIDVLEKDVYSNDNMLYRGRENINKILSEDDCLLKNENLDLYRNLSNDEKNIQLRNKKLSDSQNVRDKKNIGDNQHILDNQHIWDNNNFNIRVKNILRPTHLVFIKDWIDKFTKYMFQENISFTNLLSNNILIKSDYIFQEKFLLFFHIQCLHFLYTKRNEDIKKDIVSINNERTCDEEKRNKYDMIKYNSHNNYENIIIYLYKENNNNMEEFYEYLKNIYGEEKICFFNYEKYINNDKSFFIILLSYEELFNIYRYSNNTSYNVFQEYMESKIRNTQDNIRMYKILSYLWNNSSKDSNIQRDDTLNHTIQRYQFKIFLHEFNVIYNYKKSIIEKNLYEDLFCLIPLNNEKRITFYFLSNTHFNETIFYIWIDSIYEKTKKLCSLDWTNKNTEETKKKFFLLHNKGIIQLNKNNEHCSNLKYSSNFINEENTHKKQEDVLINIVNKKKKNVYKNDKLINEYMKGNILLSKNIISPSYIEKEENLQIHDKIKLLSNTLNICYDNNYVQTLSKQQFNNNFSHTNMLHNLRYSNTNVINKNQNFLKNNKPSLSLPCEDKNCTKKKVDENICIQKKDDISLITQNEKNSSHYLSKYFYLLNKKNISKPNTFGSTEKLDIYPCIYYIFNEKIYFLKFSKELYEHLSVLDEFSKKRMDDIIQKFKGKINITENMYIYLNKGIYLINDNINRYCERFIKELLKKNIIKIILSSVDISSGGYKVKSVFIEDVHIQDKNYIYEYNNIIDNINKLHKDIYIYNNSSKNNSSNNNNSNNNNNNNCSSSSKNKFVEHNKNDPYLSYVNQPDDIYRLHFIKYFMFLNIRNIFKKYTLSNNHLLNLTRNTTNIFLIPKKYEDIQIMLNILNDNYFNFSNMHDYNISDFYFNLYYNSIHKGINIKLFVTKMDNLVSVNGLSNNKNNNLDINTKNIYKQNNILKEEKKNNYEDYTNNSIQYDKIRDDMYYNNNLFKIKNLFFLKSFFSHIHNNVDILPPIVHLSNLLKFCKNIHSIYKYRQTNEYVFIKNSVNIYNNVCYSLNYFDFLYYYINNKNKLENMDKALKNHFVNFFLLKRKQYEKKFIKHNKELKLNYYHNKIKKLKKYFDEQYLYMYYNTYNNYNKKKKKLNDIMIMLYKEKYYRLHKYITKNYKNKVFNTIDRNKCIILDIYKDKQNFLNDKFICLNNINELIVCNIYFFLNIYENSKIKNKKNKVNNKSNDFLFFSNNIINKNFNYFDYLFKERQIITYNIYLEHYDFLFDIYNKGDHISTIRKIKRNISKFSVNKIMINHTNDMNDMNDLNNSKQISKYININKIFSNSYHHEGIYTLYNNVLLFLKKLDNMKKKLYDQYFEKKKYLLLQKRKENRNYFIHNFMTGNEEDNNLYDKNIDNSNIINMNINREHVDNEENNVLSSHFLSKEYYNNNHKEIKKKFYDHHNSHNNKPTYEIVKNEEISKSHVRNDINNNINKKILSFKKMELLNKYKKKKNTGNRNNYINELNKINRIFGNKYHTFNKEFQNIFHFLYNINMLDYLQNYINPYIKNSLWLYIITLYVKNSYSLNKNQFISQPEFLIIIFYISFYEHENNNYLTNYSHSFEIPKDSFLQHIVTDIFVYKELLQSLQNRFKVHIAIPFNLSDILQVLDGLRKLRRKDFGKINENIISKLTNLSVILHSASLYFDKEINETIFEYIGYINMLKGYKQIE
ncbi:hypothetical protein PFAG_05413 [Plasmodium falciparum Santa Lucia]|uniref:Uncharacterized protein n=4 Tax=Plasmodium falciparum TaxID=5833 RepID=W4IW07_PLAFP|nr:hypothetical protein PFMALIP_05156 [Plasmodium falciparum MaliPS096_E11]ETW53979.1 hypothetical protein PFUGPA_03852 [Plasmodium falciparum Palo Alto/Uganda]ETW58286.1 hypothetical protein PFMC_05389 [Plasmodium falciparum CAMP/Malaysia]EUT78837.1 hypothetical protein PFAG_05413 [Plasmodium falciparum Santa Lucia]